MNRLVVLLSLCCVLPFPAKGSALWYNSAKRFVLGTEVVVDNGIPEYLRKARDFVENVDSKHNQYVHKGYAKLLESIRTRDYQFYGDCSGFVSACLEVTNMLPLDKMITLNRHKSHPLAIDFFESIQKEAGFQRVETIEDVIPGDILVWKYLDQKYGKNTGHVMFINSYPRPAKRTFTQEVKGTTRFFVEIIDSSASPVGILDTRNSIFKSNNGIGKGILVLYADEETGEIVGYAKLYPRKKMAPLVERFDKKGFRKRRGVVGRPLKAFEN